jgi:hypothetical protein
MTEENVTEEQHYPPGTQEDDNNFSSNLIMGKGKDLGFPEGRRGGKGEPPVPPRTNQLTTFTPIGEFNFKKEYSGAIHKFGTFSMRRVKPFRELLEKYNFVDDLPKSFLGMYDGQLAKCANLNGSGDVELFDLNNLYLTSKQQTPFVSGDVYKVIINNFTKQTEFRELISGPYYKWETQRGLHMIFTQSDVDMLTDEEKLMLRIHF